MVAKRCTGCQVGHEDVPGLPVAERGKGLNDIDLSQGFPIDAIKHAELFIQGVHPGLYLHGDPGSGKTMLAARILTEISRRPGAPSVRFVGVLDLLGRLQAAFGDDPDAKEEADTILDQVCRVGVLVLDDVGTQKAGSDYAARTLQLIYDRRLHAGTRTIWTTNYDLDDLEARIGADRLTSRIVGECKLLHIDSGDYRFYLGQLRDRVHGGRR